MSCRRLAQSCWSTKHDEWVPDSLHGRHSLPHKNIFVGTSSPACVTVDSTSGVAQAGLFRAAETISSDVLLA